MSLVNKLFSMGFACWFALTQALLGMSTAYAQSGLMDVEPPLIEHTIVSKAESNDQQSFFANVVDDDELDSVTLYYRFANDPKYDNVEMKRISYSSTYIVRIPTDATDSRSIEYYIQARDRAGNRTVRGYAFSPLVREIKVPAPAVVSEEVEPEVVAATTNASDSSGLGSTKTILYVVLGALTLGLIAGLSGDSTDNPPPGPPAGDCPDGLCTVSITVGAP